MVLHYTVNTVSQASVNGFQDPILFQSNDTGHVPAISIVMGTDEPDNNTTRRCDSTSVRSVKDEMALFGQDRHVHFPRVDGNQQSHTYEPGCEDQTQMLKKASLLTIRYNLKVVRSYLETRDQGKIPSTHLALEAIRKAISSMGPIPGAVQNELDAIGKLLQLQTQASQSRSAPSLDSIQVAGDNLSVDRIEGYVHATSAGAGDCRGAQLNINGAIPGP